MESEFRYWLIKSLVRMSLIVCHGSTFWLPAMDWRDSCLGAGRIYLMTTDIKAKLISLK
jgi:hypothetical protein